LLFTARIHGAPANPDLLGGRPHPAAQTLTGFILNVDLLNQLFL